MTFTISTASWGWPQWLLVILLVLDVAMSAANHGKPKTTFNVGTSVFSAVILLAVLIAGGFFA